VRADNSHHLIDAAHRRREDCRLRATAALARLLATGPDVVLHQAVIVVGREYVQQALPARNIAPDSMATLQRKLQGRYQWKPVSGQRPAVLFVQMDPKPEHQKESLLNLMAIFDERNTVEGEISEALELHQLGSWAASDLGPGGMNILFEVSDVNAALPVVLQALARHKAQSRVRIARQLLTAPDDWRYEVIYPVAFNGTFNSL